ncbi:hypothetical protein, unlikely [Trypanosoma brucei gambiense DAL972]|uniref:Uncharacterized protein n=3 Tax=Trypanosoma brucei TaxID=5691 RepID=Q4GZC7_TRYB2|nr:hypothetical protein, unlikely [Trypanosoma brucei brucei TREU927]XP_011771280.1 hypothetical protein, unlikely [Trypanosoma brucei gambiense DAL972]RHW74444.1 hypothetical protein DPX39_010013100 [Trypanosoma brucei equiperdum]CAJ16013.1 hypothetical protein, unlikely [Trypanosoma brucei brucei TREU927]CBH08839.1 hypothetical protein, unlikely [Trypanosoma brucei gambiense DAL972]|eukprot:XP_011771280.1 hypothetical protein, unlikely [Trypanosoma brucei gambiense DAL972]
MEACDTYRRDFFRLGFAWPQRNTSGVIVGWQSARAGIRNGGEVEVKTKRLWGCTSPRVVRTFKAE